jgi:hypothetical protein
MILLGYIRCLEILAQLASSPEGLGFIDLFKMAFRIEKDRNPNLTASGRCNVSDIAKG